jgi:PAS domain S-box-containing protein
LREKKPNQMANAGLRRSRAVLAEVHDWFRDLYDRVPAGYVILSASGLMLEVNLAAASLLGLERERLAGTPFERFLDREDLGRWSQLLPTLFRADDVRSFRLGLRRHDGSSLRAHLTCQRTRDQDDRPAVRVIVVDVGDQVDIEDALRRRQERLSSVLDEFSEGYWNWSASTGETLVSGRLGTMLGVAEGPEGAELAFDPAWPERVHPDDLPAARTAVGDLLDGRRDRCEVELRWSMPGVTWIWIRVRGRVLRRDGAGGARRLAGTVADITETRQLREALHRFESLGTAPEGEGERRN